MKARFLSTLSLVPLLLLGCSGGDFAIADDAPPEDDVLPETNVEDTLAADAPEEDADVGDADASGDADADVGADAADDANADAAEACATNACGGCAILAAAPGAACGTCGTLAYACSTDKQSVVCPGDDKNGCGGCAALAHEPGTKCGACGSGSYACSGTNATICNDPVTNPPGAKCGMCSTSSYVCSGPTTVCAKSDDRTSARDALAGSSGPQGYVNQSLPGVTYRYALAFKTDRAGSLAGFFVGLYQYDHDKSTTDTGLHFRLILGAPTLTPAPANVLADVTIPGTAVSATDPYGVTVSLATPTASYPAGTAFYVEIGNASPRFNYRVAGGPVATPSKTDWYYALPGETSYTQDTKFDPHFAVDMKGCY